MYYHMIAFLAGFLLDLLIGDPHWLYHPVRLIGNLIAALDHRLLDVTGIRNEKKERRAGILLVTVVLLATGAVSGLLLWGAYAIAPMAGCILESIMTYQILATKCLKVESMKVYERLRADDLAGARNAVAMIVGRDTQNLDAAGVAKAAVETVAENTSDGVIAPMICLAIGGPVLGFLYKAVNTMDSMVGYKNEKYLYFGRFAAKVDDVLNYIPARLSALLWCGSRTYRSVGKKCLEDLKRDRYNHASPNSAQTEAAMAGALGVQLAGDAWYFGTLYKKKRSEMHCVPWNVRISEEQTG